MTEKTETSKSPRGVVLFDGDCGMCLRSVARMRPLLEPRNFDFRPFADGMEKFEIKLIQPDGTLLGGAEALVAMARSLWWLRPFTFLTLLPGVMPLLRAAYRKIAANRHCMSGACGWTPPVKPALP